MKELTEQEILKGLRDEDKLLYESTSVYLWKTIAPKIFGMVLKNSGSREDATDLFTDTLLKVQKNVQNGTYQMQNLFSAYFMRVAKNAWLDELRRRTRNQGRTWQEIDSEAAYFKLLDEGDADVVEYVVYNEKWTAIHQIWQQWEDTVCKMRLTFFHLDGKSMSEIADLEGLTVENMRQRVLHCRRRFIALVNRLRR